MGENIKELLNEEIAAEIQAISSLDSGSEKKSKAIEDLAKLYRLRIEESKNELDAEDKRSRRTLESEASIREHEIKQSQLDEQIKADVQDEQFKSCQLNEQMKDRYFKVGIAAAELLIPLMFYQVIIPLAEIGEFSATAHKVTDEGIMFIFDEYITRRPMNSKNTNKGGFEKSELKKWMDTVLLMTFPEELRDKIYGLTLFFKILFCQCLMKDV